MKNAINFTRANKTVKADKYVIHALYTQNKALVESLGGTVIKGNKTFTAEFPSTKKANEFVKKAITSMSEEEYNATRKPKAVEDAPKKSEKNAPAKPTKRAKKDASAPPAAGKKVKTEAPKKPYKSSKGNAETSWKSDLDALKGKGKKANKEAAAILRKHNMACVIGSEGWDYWSSIR